MASLPLRTPNVRAGKSCSVSRWAQGTGRSQVFVISLWDTASVKEAEDFADQCSAVVADIVGGGIARHRANVLRAIPGPGGTWATTGASASKTQPVDVLVLEDEAAMAQTSADVLRAAGFTVATSATVDEALVVITSRVVGSVLLDHEKAQRFLAEGRDLPPVIVLSDPGSDIFSGFQVAEIEQLFACLSMPVARADLIAAVKAALGHREAGAGDVRVGGNGKRRSRRQ